MKPLNLIRILLKNSVFVAAISFATFQIPAVFAMAEEAQAAAEPEKGPHRGRMLREGDLALELSIFETGVPPEFRVWFTDDGKPVSPADVKVNVKLTRLGDVVDNINFYREGEFLRGDMTIYEPHSFFVTVEAVYQGKTLRWAYENYEGRTTIEAKVAEAMGIETEIAGAQTIHQSIPVYGELAVPDEGRYNISARFEGQISKVLVARGERVKKGQALMTIESNESLKPYTVYSPANGVVTKRTVNPGEQTANRTLLEITDTSTMIARIAVYPEDYRKVKKGSAVSLTVVGSDSEINGQLLWAEHSVSQEQAQIWWVRVPNNDENFKAGSFVHGRIEVATFDVPLAVKRSGLQAFRDFTVVYAKVGQQYEVRMLELGRQGEEWIEVLGGLEPGTVYVTENSYVLKADIEKSGASHDH